MYETWRAFITNVIPSVAAGEAPITGTNFAATCSAVDKDGNTIVGGHYQLDNFASGGWHLAKFSPAGTLLWHHRFETGAMADLDDLALDDRGRIYTSIRRGDSDPRRALAVIQSSPDGVEIMRWEDDALPANGLFGASSVKLDAHGNALVLHVLLTGGKPVPLASKYDVRGRQVFRIQLPVEGYSILGGGMRDCWVVTPDGGLILAGSSLMKGRWRDTHAGFALRLDARGKVMWKIHSSDISGLPQVLWVPFQRVAVGGDSRLAVFHSNNGRTLWTRGLTVGANQMHLRGDGSILIQQSVLLSRFAWNGTPQWITHTGLSSNFIGGVPDSGDGWIAAGASPFPSVSPMFIRFVQVDGAGQIQWQTDLPAPNFYGEFHAPRPQRGMHLAPDGTLRLVLNTHYGLSWQPSPSGIAVLAYELSRD